MPTSDYHHISDVLHVVEQIGPRRVLDIGVGSGKWGVLCREITEIYQGRLERSAWTSTIDGIEIFEPYRNELWEYAYNTVHIGDALSLIDQLPTYDIILCGDVIEHFPKDVALDFIKRMLAHAEYAIITSPRGFVQQDEHYGNAHERHLSGWRQHDFDGFPHIYKDIGFTFMAILAKSPGSLKRLKVIRPLDVLGVKKGLMELLKLGVARARLRLGRA